MKMENDILHLTLKKKWFDMILSGEKKEEYREYKDYWVNRLVKRYIEPNTVEYFIPKVIRFTNGYGKDKPTFDIVCRGMRVYDNGKPEWGAPKDNCFIFSLGKIISTNNIQTLK